jgi:hypothetical protein
MLRTARKGDSRDGGDATSDRFLEAESAPGAALCQAKIRCQPAANRNPSAFDWSKKSEPHGRETPDKRITRTGEVLLHISGNATNQELGLLRSEVNTITVAR